MTNLKSTKNQLYSISDVVRCGDIEGEVVKVGPNYVVVIAEGKEHRFWTKNVQTSTKQPKRNQLYKDAFLFKGYKTKNFTRKLSESFKNLSKEKQDDYAVLNCVKTFDYLIGLKEDSIPLEFFTAKQNIDKAKKYINKFPELNFFNEIISEIDAELFRYAVLEELSYTTTDRLMIARVISNVAGVPVLGVNPTNIINIAVQKLKVAPLNQQGWALLGRMLNVATKAGIKWNKDNFNPSIKKQMGLIE